MTKYIRPLLGLIVVVAMTAGFGYAQQTNSQQAVQSQPSGQAQIQAAESTAKVINGQKTKIEGVIVKRDTDSLLVRDYRGGDYLVSVGGTTQIREKKSNPFRGAKKYTTQQLMQGMTVEVDGRGGSTGNLVADKVRFTDTDLRVAESINTRVTPVEQNLTATSQRVGQAEMNAQRMSGQIQELEAVSNAARGGAKAAQETADTARESADAARQSADTANAGVRTANERITSIDDYQVKDSVIVSFKVGSSLLSKEAQTELAQVADQAKNERAFVIEVTGFASAEGSKTLNQRLSQRRADEVIHYLAENYDIPMRRFITPMGLGTSRPVGDNKTREGRTENRRVEVKVLVSRALQGMQGSNAPTTGSIR